MSRPVILRPAAQREFDDATDWYLQAGPGLADRFVDAVQDVFDTIASDPQRYPLIEGDVREAPVSDFPYAVYYRVRPRRLVVLAVYHQSRDPDGWHGRS